MPETWLADLVKITAPLAKLNPKWPFKLERGVPRAHATSPGGTDSSSFEMLSVPTLRFTTQSDYNYRHAWHTLHDLYSELVPYTEHQQHSALVTAVVAYGAANLEKALPAGGVYLPDGLYADLAIGAAVAPVHIMTNLDLVNAPLQTANFVRIVEGKGGAQRGPGAGGPPPGMRPGGPPGGGSRPEVPPIGTIDIRNGPVLSAQPQAQAAEFGSDTTLSVNVSGTGPFSYQWRFNGVDIPGATDSSLVLPNLDYADGGLYTVAIGSPLGWVISSPAAVNVGAILLSQLTPAGLKLTWSGDFVLQAADSPVGPFVDMPGAVTPYVHQTAGTAQKFFRLRAADFTVTTSPLPGGQTAISVTGTAGAPFILQRSPDMLNWTTIGTEHRSPRRGGLWPGPRPGPAGRHSACRRGHRGRLHVHRRPLLVRTRLSQFLPPARFTSSC